MASKTIDIDGTSYRTERVDYERERAFGRIHHPDVLGCRALFTAFDGARRVGTVVGEMTSPRLYLKVMFPGGGWARLDRRVTFLCAEG